ncbi:YycH family regulatory protein [Aureibacillus halotolerans]|uniref:Regulatory protein YycH of two-component signal transduction system YycFG n=1 Tax=Aureibacillus halotolerans TaxID=1508390 RepID=A0A4R6TXT7_9BACI|nr:two-component system activity regulator YycH [Aureibacillus halotolerans]TDQ38371.1 regulatory protein YycH of two-component signal transduction system YycFG [Aureibacillus halotolerans]
MMKYKEHIKSGLLVLLILGSLVLTWSVWTYQPQFIEAPNTEYVQSVEIGEQLPLSELVQPVQAMYHENGEVNGTTSRDQVEALFASIRKGQLGEVKPVLSEDFINNGEILEGRTEFVFPESLPLSLLPQLIPAEGQVSETGTFDRLVVDISQPSTRVYFVSNDNDQVYQAALREFDRSNYISLVDSTLKSGEAYFRYEPNAGSLIYMPVDIRSVPKLTYSTMHLSAEKFKDALFSNPSYVKKDNTSSSEESYTDGTRLLRVYKNNQQLSYINPAQTEYDQLSGGDLISRSYDFINDHAGWTDTYRLYHYSISEQTVRYQLYIGQHPVFHTYRSYGYPAIYASFKNGEIHEYLRPLFRLRFEFDRTMIDLASGQTIVDALESAPDIDPSMVQDVKVGYEMARQPNTNPIILSFQPVWYVKYNDSWQKVSQMTEGGDSVGLE